MEKIDTTKQNGWVIDAPSQGLLQEAIRTFPLIVPLYSEIVMDAMGIPAPWIYKGKKGGEKEEEHYLSRCKKEGIIPYSELTLKYDHDSRSFVPLEKSILERSIIGIKKKDSLESLIAGGRISRIVFEGNFEEFRENYFELMLDQGYLLQEADLLNEGYKGVTLKARRLKGLKMYLDEAFEEKDVCALKHWYFELHDKHSGQTKLFEI